MTSTDGGDSGNKTAAAAPAPARTVSVPPARADALVEAVSVLDANAVLQDTTITPLDKPITIQLPLI